VNWRRVWSGAFLAGAVVYLGESVLRNRLSERAMTTWCGLPTGPSMRAVAGQVAARIVTSLVIGFCCSFLYALSRPRFGPGSQTALRMGTLVGALIALPSVLWIWGGPTPARLIALLLGRMLEVWVAAYLAGWQYIEKSP